MLKFGYRLSGKTINKPRPYDEANYYYAIEKSDGIWDIRRDGKLVDTIEVESNDEVAEHLNMVNSAIKPRMCHN